MIRIFLSLGASAIALIAASCCCTGEAGAPRLRPLTKFQEIEIATPAPAPAPAPPRVHHEK